MENKPRLKDRLARIFRPPALLRSSSAAASSRSFSAGESARSFSAAADIAHEPIFISRSRAGEADGLHSALLSRSLSLDRHSRRNFCGGCRPKPANSPSLQNKEVKEKNRKLERSDFDTEELKEGDAKTCPPSFESPMSAHLYYYWIKEPDFKKKKKKKMMMRKQRKQRTRSNRHELSISSSLNEEGFGLFSSEETDTFFSSRSFSSDSSEFYRRPKTRKSCKKKQSERSDLSSRQRKKASMRRRDGSNNGFHPLVSVSFNQQNEGFAVLKKSTDPYSDFRSSMVEMIVERQIFGAEELQRLLHSYLSLNSTEIHSAIFRAFADITKVLFSY